MDNYAKKVMLICASLLENGAEISRVEDTAKRLLNSGGYKEVNVFCISSLIIFSTENGILIKRINKSDIRLAKIDYYNQLSRSICEKKPFEYSNKPYPLWLNIIAVILGCGSFTLYFGGNIFDAVFSSLIGLIINFRKTRISFAFAKTLCDSFIAGVLSVFISFIPLSSLHYDKIMIGTIMLLVPGITTVNGVKDIMKADILSGLIELTEAVFTALAIALGFSAAVVMLK